MSPFVLQELEKTREALSAKKGALDRSWAETKELKRQLADLKGAKDVSGVKCDKEHTYIIPTMKKGKTKKQKKTNFAPHGQVANLSVDRVFFRSFVSPLCGDLCCTDKPAQETCAVID